MLFLDVSMVIGLLLTVETKSVASVQLDAVYFFFSLVRLLLTYRHFLSKSYLTQDKLAYLKRCHKQLCQEMI